jgi:acetoin utilization deacetylase AcuC-like enzyme
MLLPVVHHPLYSAPQLPPGHRFPMGVFQNIYDVLIQQSAIIPQQVHIPPSLPSRSVLELVHTPEYVSAFCSGQLDAAAMRRIGFGDVTSTEILINRTKAEVAGTLLTAELALQHKLAVNTAGGTHHAFADSGSGFCILNDLAITAESLISRNLCHRILILDLDVHQGDGTASLFQNRSDVFTLSIHAANNFPARKQSSHLDLGLLDGTGDDEYLAAVAEALINVLQSFKPDLVLYDAGVDIHIDDSLGRLNITDEGLARREMLVLDSCLGSDIAVAGVVGGGYHADLNVLAERHCWLHKAASQLWDAYQLGKKTSDISSTV